MPVNARKIRKAQADPGQSILALGVIHTASKHMMKPDRLRWGRHRSCERQNLPNGVRPGEGDLRDAALLDCFMRGAPDRGFLGPIASIGLAF